MINLSQNLNQIQQIITETEVKSSRQPGSVLLLAVSKQQNLEAIQDLYQLGIHHFGESYFQEAQQKIKALTHLPLTWHFIGPIQSNKTKGIAHSFSWVHSISRLTIAEQLNEHRAHNPQPLNVCIQINLIDESTKSGIFPAQAEALVSALQHLPHLKLRGLMTIPPQQTDPQKQYNLLVQLRELMHNLNKKLNLHMDTLSMGMSDDFVPAIKAGSTIVRIGRALFGERQK